MNEIEFIDAIDTLTYIRATLQVMQSACNNNKELEAKNLAMLIDVLYFYIDCKVEDLNERLQMLQ